MFSRFAVLLLLWTVFGALGYTRHYLQEAVDLVPIAFWPEFFAWLACYYAWVPLTPLVFRLERRFPLGAASWRRSVSVLTAASILFSYGAYLLTLALTLVIRTLEHRPFSVARPIWAIPGVEFCIEQFLFWSIVVAAYVLRKFRELRERERETARFAVEKAQLEATLRKAELETVRMRLNPHFLFNSLQNISVLAQQDARTASRMLTRLGDLLRTAFQRNFQFEVTLEAEIALTHAYLDIEKMRFGDRLCIDLEIAPETAAARVPSLLLQPLVENAIVHGLAEINRESSRIWIRSRTDDGRLILVVADNGTGFGDHAAPEFGKGIGLGSTRDRLARMYPGEHEIVVTSGAGGGTEVRIALPLRKLAQPTFDFL